MPQTHKTNRGFNLLQEIIDRHTIPGVVSFAENEHGLVYASISSAACTAVIYLQGAHLAEWCPSGQQPVLFMSDRSMKAPGKAIRGGVPIVFPWFGARTANEYSSRTDGPSHGFARTSEWQVVGAKVRGNDVILTLSLDPDDSTRSLGYDAFRLVYELVIGENLELHLTVENRSEETISFEEALHTYFLVGDARQISIHGLEGTDYFDKTDKFKRKRQTESVLKLTGETDRPYVGAEAVVEISDPVFQRRIIVSKQNSRTTVVWNPWTELTAKLADMSPDGWMQMVCIETANALEDAIVLASGERHTMIAQIAAKVYEEQR
jgi:Uncharacterized enzymes related to aldose 1-epimerase